VPLRHWDSGNAATARARSSSALRATPSLQAAMPAVDFRKRWWHVEHSYAHTLPGNTYRKSAAVNLYHSTDDCTVGNHTVQSKTQLALPPEVDPGTAQWYGDSFRCIIASAALSPPAALPTYFLSPFIRSTSG